MGNRKYYISLTIIAVFATIAILQVVKKYIINPGQIKVVIHYEAIKNEKLSIYWDAGDAWKQDNSSDYFVKPGKSEASYTISGIPRLVKLRIDPDSASDSINVSRVCIYGLRSYYECKDFISCKTNGLNMRPLPDGFSLIRDKKSDDPYLVLEIPPGISAVDFRLSWPALMILIITGLCCATGFFLILNKKIFYQQLSNYPNRPVFGVLFFLLLISGIWLNHLFGFYIPPANHENRVLARQPGLTLLVQRPDSFFRCTNSWFADYFDFRSAIVAANSMMYLKLFNTSGVKSRVMLGKALQMFPVNDLLKDDFYGVKRFSSFELIVLKHCLDEKTSYLKERGIPYFLVIPPSKQTIYKEFLPDWYRLRENTSEMLKQFKYFIHADTVNQVIFLGDSIQKLMEEKPFLKTFYSNDIHWNEYGAFKGYQIMMNELNKKFPYLGRPLKDSEITIDTVYDNEGDLAKCLLLNNYLLRETYHINPKVPVPVSIQYICSRNVFPVVRLYNPKGKGKLLVFRDSFSEQWMKYIAWHFNECIFIWDQHIDQELIDEYKPDIVIQEICEMFLMNLFIPVNSKVKINESHI